MTTLTGTSGNAWRDFATKLSSMSGGNISVLDASADHLAKHLRGNAKADVIIFAESPASLIANGAKDPGPLLDEWTTCASAILAFWRKNRQRAVIFHWGECLADSSAFEELLAKRLGRSFGKSARPLAPSEIPLAARVIADVIVARDREAARLWNELQAASQPISKKAAVLAQPNPELALSELSQQQKRSAAEHHTLATRLAALESDHSLLSTLHSSLIAERGDLVTRHSSLVAERNDLLVKLDESKQRSVDTSEMLLQEIQNAHKESEDFFEQLEIARADCESTKQELAATRAAHDITKQELQQVAATLQQLQAAKQDSETRQHALQEQLTALQTESQSIKENALRNHEMLLLELQNAHKESEDFFEQWKSLEASVQPHFLTAERILRGGEKHHPPHNHLDYVFESASLFERHWRRLPARLVEHHGNAGLALFHPSGNGTAPLYHWEPNGQESGLDFMLFVPSDKKAAGKLAGLPASDLLLVHDAAAKILGHLCVHEDRESDRWLPVARRLLQEIEEIPERLHYNSVAGFLHRENNHFRIRFNVAKLYFRGSCSSSFVVDWMPASSGGTLRLDRSKVDQAMLVSSAPEVLVGFASNEAEGSIRALWPRLTGHDQAFLLLLAKALPDFVFHLCEQQPDQRSNKERLTKQARKLYRRLRNLDRRQRLRGAIAKLIRR